jgi:hypothetical protein
MNRAGKARVIRNHFRLGLLLSAFLAILNLENALAHKTSLTAAEVNASGKQVAFRLKVSAHDLAVALGIKTDLIPPVSKAAFAERKEILARYLRARLAIRTQNTPCLSNPPKIDYTFLPEELVLIVDCNCSEPPEGLTIDYLLFFDIDPTHRSLGKIIFPSGEEQFLFERTLTRLEFEITRPQRQSWTALFGRVFFLGVEHILIGYDHILFLLALLIVSVNFWQMVKVASAFTVAHSIIAVSIAYVAIENIVRQHFGHRWVLAGGFGLVHGLGFYSALRDLGLGRRTRPQRCWHSTWELKPGRLPSSLWSSGHWFGGGGNNGSDPRSAPVR